jgi:hypothetical protein
MNGSGRQLRAERFGLALGRPARPAYQASDNRWSETGFKEITDDFPEPDFWIIERAAALLGARNGSFLDAPSSARWCRAVLELSF